MAHSGQSFREFEQAGWEDSSVVTTYHEHLSGVTTQSVDALLDAAGVRNGSRVLDVATGAGYVAGAAAQRGAAVVGIDFSAAQVRMARERYPAVRFEQADAEALSFEPDTFDAVVNGFGMCHFPNPDVALREAFRVLKRGGRVAFNVWDTPERAVGFGAVYAAVRAHGSLDVGLPAGPNFFPFSDPEQSTTALRHAGFVSPSCRQVLQVWRIADADELFEVITEGTVRAAATLRAQSPQARDAIRAALRDTVTAYKRGQYFEVTDARHCRHSSQAMTRPPNTELPLIAFSVHFAPDFIRTCPLALGKRSRAYSKRRESHDSRSERQHAARGHG